MKTILRSLVSGALGYLLFLILQKNGFSEWQSVFYTLLVSCLIGIVSGSIRSYLAKK